MPVIDGKVRRSRFTSLKISELSAVDNPAQPGATMAIMKRDFSADQRQRMADSGEALPDGSYPIANVSDLKNAIHAFGRAKNSAKVKAHIIRRARALDALDQLPEDWKVKKQLADLLDLAKYMVDGDEGAETFQEVLAESQFNQNVWPCVDALSQSIRSIVGDSSLSGGERDAKISESVDQFLQAVRDISPEVSKQLSELCRKREGPMPKTVEELQAALTKAEGQLEDATKRAETEKARADKAEGDLAAANTALEAAKAEGGELATVKAELQTVKADLAKATEETIKVGETEIKKSVVGPEQFAMAKAIADERDTAKLEKRADTEFRHVTGSAAEKAAVLKLVDDLPADNPTRKAFEAIITSAEKMAANAFDRLGSQGGQTPTQKAAQSTFDDKVSEIQKRDSLSRSAAMSKARTEFPEEFEAAYGDGAEQSAAAAS